MTDTAQAANSGATAGDQAAQSQRTPNIPPGLPDEFVSLAQLRMINNREIVQLCNIEPATARLRLESHARPQPIIRPVCHCKPDLLKFCALNYSPDELIQAQVLPENNNPTVYFAFQISPELHATLNPRAQAQAAQFDPRNLPQGEVGQVAMFLSPLLMQIIETQKMLAAKMEQMQSGGSEEVQAARDMMKASLRAMTTKFEAWAKEAEDPGAAAVRQIKQSTELITTLHNTAQTSFADIRKMFPMAAPQGDWAMLEKMWNMATSPQAQRAFMGFLYMLGAKNIGYPGQDANPGQPNSAPKGTFQAETVK